MVHIFQINVITDPFWFKDKDIEIISLAITTLLSSLHLQETFQPAKHENF